ncbi:hypothetical protein [Pseudomonas sp. TE3610]
MKLTISERDLRIAKLFVLAVLMAGVAVGVVNAQPQAILASTSGLFFFGLLLYARKRRAA